MSISLAQLYRSIPHLSRIIGLDIGGRKIGIAISDRSWMIATAFGMKIRAEDNKYLLEIKQICEENSVGGMIAGLPLHMDGKISNSTLNAEKIALEVAEFCSLPLSFIDERLSTSAANRALKEANFTRKKRESLDDKVAAAYILQQALDVMQNFR